VVEVGPTTSQPGALKRIVQGEDEGTLVHV